MANEVRIVVTTDDLSKAGLDSAEAKTKASSERVKTDLDGVSKKGTETGEKIGAGFDKGGKSADDFDRLLTSTLKDGQTGFESVSRQVDVLRGKITTLTADFAQTGNKGIFGDLKSSQADLRVLESLLDDMAVKETKAGAAAKEFDRLVTSSMSDGQTAFQAVSKAVDDLKAKITGLQADFKQTGSQSILGDLTSAKSDLQTLESIVAQMVGDIPKKANAGDAGKKIAVDLEKGVESVPFVGGISMGIARMLTGLISDAGVLGEKAGKALGDGIASATDAAAQDIPQMFTPEGAIGALIVAAIVGGLATVAGGALATALSLAVGIGFIGVGAMILKNNATIVSGFRNLKTEIGTILQGAAEPLVGPFHDALLAITSEVVSLGPALHGIFAAVAPAVGLFTGGLTTFLDYFIPKMQGVAAAFTAMFESGSVQTELKVMVLAFTSLFTYITQNKSDVTDFFVILLGVIDGVIIGVRILEQAWTVLVFLWKNTPIGPLTKGLADLVGMLKQHHDATTASATSTQAFGGQLADTAAKAVSSLPTWDQFVQKLNDVKQTASSAAGALTDKLIGGMLSSDQAANDFDKSLVTLGDTLAANGGHLTAHVQALKKSETGAMQNKDAILAVVQANLRVYDTQIAAGISADDAAGAYDRNTKALEAQLRAGGMNSTQIQNMIGKYEKVPDKVNTDLAIDGLSDAINNLDNLLRQLNGLPLVTTINVEEIYRESHVAGGGTAPPTPKRVAKPVVHHATGGILGSTPSTYGEEGWELLKMPGAMVASHADSVSRTSAPPSSSASRTATAVVEFVGNVDTVVAAMFQKLIRTGQIRLTVKNSAVVAG